MIPKKQFVEETQRLLWDLASVYNIFLQYFKKCLETNQLLDEDEIFELCETHELEYKEIHCHNQIYSLQFFKIPNMPKIEQFEFQNYLDVHGTDAERIIEDLEKSKEYAKQVYVAIEADNKEDVNTKSNPE